MSTPLMELPAWKIRKHHQRTQSVSIEGVEHFLLRHKSTKPIGKALKEEFGKRISEREYWDKSLIRLDGKKAFAWDSMGLQGILTRINHRINLDIKREAGKHLK